MFRTRIVGCALGISLLTACDVMVTAGQMTTLGNRGAIFALNTPNAVNVRPGGALVVEDADLFGLGKVVEQGDFPDPVPGAAIVSDGGFVRVVQGTVTGGNLLVVAQAPNTPPVPPRSPAPSPSFSAFLELPPALVATGSRVEIDGGLLISGGQFGLSPLAGLSGPFGDPSQPIVLPFVSPAVSVASSDVRIRGGEFRRGTAMSEFSRALGAVLEADLSRVAISGGSFTGSVDVRSSLTRISGGALFSLTLGSPLRRVDPNQGAQGCTEIHGGSIGQVGINASTEILFVFGTDFNLPLGPVTIPEVSGGPGFIGANIALPSVTVTGVLADGTPLDLDVFSTVLPAHVVLAAPGTPACAP